LEEDLDRIEEGEMSRVDALNEFYGPFSARLGALEKQLEDGEERPFQVPSDVACDVCGSPMELRYWKGTHFLGCSRYPECKNTVNVPPNVEVIYTSSVVKAKDALAKAAATSIGTIECAKCGGDMELRTGRYGRYYRCTNADCGETAPVSTGVACPECEEGTLVEKYSTKRRRAFYSCNRYPKCRFAVSDRPVKPCPSCGTGLVVEKQGELRCTSKECGYREEPEGGASASHET
jgi:DNA topoisomerase-1